MSEAHKFSFGDNSVAGAYDSVLVPVLFEPWAAQIIEEHQPWEGRCVLDVATGSGIFAHLVTPQVGPSGSVVGIDINSEMLSIAIKRCAGLTPEVKLIESPAYPLEIPSNSIDVVVCQQGFQFFPDKDAAAKEMQRVLRDGGKVIVTTWRPVDECQFFGTICDALSMIGESEISDMMRLPFDFMPESQLKNHFKSAGFADVQISRQEQEFRLEGGVKHAIDVAYATPIRPKLLALPEERQTTFRNTFAELIGKLSGGGISMGRMVSNVLTAKKEL